jgi:signal transduction histidine kinase
MTVPLSGGANATGPRPAGGGERFSHRRRPGRPRAWPRFLPRFYSRRSVLGLLWLSSVFLPLLAAALGGWMTWRLVVETEIDRMTRATQAACAQTLRALETGDVALVAVAAAIEGKDWASIAADPGLALFVHRLVAAGPATSALSLVAPDGREVVPAGGKPGLGSEKFPGEAVPVDRETIVIAPGAGKELRQLKLVRLRRDSGGRPDGLLVLSFDSRVFEAMFAHLVPTSGAGLALLDPRGRVGVHTAGFSEADAAELAGWGDDGAPGQNGPSWLRKGTLLHGFRLALVQPVEPYRLLMIYRADSAALWAEWGHRMAPIALGALGMMGLLGALTVQAQSRLAEEREHAARLAAAENAAALEHVEAEARLREVEKVAALGQLSAGVAHDFNNLLQGILVSADSLSQSDLPPGEAAKIAALILRACDRGMALTRRMLEFARRDRPCVEATDLARSLRDVGELLGRLLGRSCRVHIAPISENLRVRCHPAEFESVIINLAVNARDAMPRGGTITVDIAPVEAPPGRVRVVVGDTGCGMDSETLARVGEAFFTTKEIGRGTGLGLSMARGFARRCGGRLDIDSAPGKGTRVSLTLKLMGDGNETSRREG